MRSLRIVGTVLLVLTGLLLAGCASERVPIAADQPLAPQLDARKLDAVRTDHIGDASAVIDVLQEARLWASGRYTIELSTEAEPYGLTITFDTLTMRMLDETQHRRLIDTSVLALTLIKNLEWVAYEFPHDTAIPPEGRLTTADANQFVGFDVKALPADADGVQQVLDALVAKPYPEA